MTMSTRRPTIVGNWKMNLGGRQGFDQIRRLIAEIGLLAIWRSARQPADVALLRSRCRQHLRPFDHPSTPRKDADP
jgi:hypothetical protein